MFEQLHQILLGFGFHYLLVRNIPRDASITLVDQASGFYVKEYVTTEGAFKVALSFQDDPYTELPSAFIIRRPEKYQGCLLPHINLGGYLCYVEQKEADWDPNDLPSTYSAIDEQIQNTLEDAVSSAERGVPYDNEIEGEFASYWCPQKTMYLLSTPQNDKLQCYIARAKSAHNGKSEEWVVCSGGQYEESVKWSAQRNLDVDRIKSFPTFYFRIKPTSLGGITWPPKDFKNFLEWLSKVDPAGKTRLLDNFANNPVKRRVLLFDVFGQDIIGLYVELNNHATELKRYTRRKGQRKRNHGNLANSLSGKNSFKEFIRVGVIRADKETLMSRNSSRPKVGDLGSRRIALIGCGTIGGYVASLILRSGAGCGNGYLHIYDDDDYKPHNFGRHPLPSSYFGENKALAMTDHLQSSIHQECKIVGINRRFPITTETLKKYDVIIDATGRPPVSKRISSTVRSLSLEDRPVVIHGFNDGNGRDSKVLIDNGSCCFGCMLAEPMLYQNGVDTRFEGIDQSAEKRVSCGSTYTPYDAAVSTITASMIQEAALYTLEEKLPWTYCEHMFDGSKSRKPKIQRRQNNCEICHGRC